MKLVTIVGARPQFIKAASVSRAIEHHNRKAGGPRITEIMIHTGQHYDYNMSKVFFDELEMQTPDYHLGVGSGSHGRMTGGMLEKIEQVLLGVQPQWVLVYGDTNSTLAGALAASKLHIPVAHVEAGLRSFNREMPEEINRLLTDHISSLLFCPTDVAVVNLQKEGITKGVFKVGDVMFDSFLFYQQLAQNRSDVLSRLGLKSKCFCLATVHREENASNGKKIEAIFAAFKRLATVDCPFVVPLHPRTSRTLAEVGGQDSYGPAIHVVEPVSYLDMVLLETHAKVILTDSGGVQKEAYFAQVPCITLRNETEWVELVEHGFNRLGGHDTERICNAFGKMVERNISLNPDLYGCGKASEETVLILGRLSNP